MPKSGPPSKERGGDMAVVMALTIGPPPSRGTPEIPGVRDEQDLEDAYKLHRETLIDQSPPCRRAWGYWRYERGVPEGFRSELPRLEAVKPDESASRLSNTRHAVELQREIVWLEWLAENDKLDAEELRVLPRVQRELRTSICRRCRGSGRRHRRPALAGRPDASQHPGS